MILTFDSYIPPVTFKSGKTGPPRYKAAGQDYILAKGVEVALNTPYECVVDITHDPTGKYTNHVVKAAIEGGSRIPAAAPESAPAHIEPTSFHVTPTPSPTEAAGGGTHPQVVPAASPSAWMPDADRQRLIVRQSCLKASVEFINGNGPEPGWSLDNVLRTADEMVAWVYNSPSEKKPAEPKSPASQHLEDARQKAHDRRADYNLEDAVCPSCGYREFLKQWSGGWFCAPSKTAGEPGGCGYPRKGERLDSPPSYGEWLQGQSATLRRPDAPLVSPSTHPTR